MKEMREYEAEVRRRIGEKTDQIKRTRRTLGVILPLMLCVVIAVAAVPAMTSRDGKGKSLNAVMRETELNSAEKDTSTDLFINSDVDDSFLEHDVPAVLRESEEIFRGTVISGRIPDPDDATLFTDRVVLIRVDEVFYGNLKSGDEVEIFIPNSSHNAENDGIIPEDDEMICDGRYQLSRGQEDIFCLNYLENDFNGEVVNYVLSYGPDGLFSSDDGMYYSSRTSSPRFYKDFYVSELPRMIEEAKTEK